MLCLSRGKVGAILRPFAAQPPPMPAAAPSPLLPSRLVTAIDRLNTFAGQVAALLLVALVALVFAQVVARDLFDSSSVALQELSQWLHASAFLLGLGYALRHDAHVRVDVLAQRCSPRTRAVIELAGAVLLLLPLCIFIIAMSWDYVATSWAIGEGSRDPGGLPAWYLLKSLLPVSALLLGLQGVAMALRAALALRGDAA